MKTSVTPITFTAIAKVAGASTWLVYAEGIREYIEQARADQATTPDRATATGTRASAASLRTDLELARQDNRALRSEVDRLKTDVRHNLGRQLDEESTHQLRSRVDHLTAANSKLQDEIRGLTKENVDLQNALRTTEDDLTAARAGLRRMIREQTSQLDRELGRRVLDERPGFVAASILVKDADHAQALPGRAA
uniref:hypothetical protein n=1 Tax=Rhodococcus qingshengii TaxID=334542 RepID=UPI001C4DF773|nr:hypothetical protein [Rhodococcus qingshengii]